MIRPIRSQLDATVSFQIRRPCRLIIAGLLLAVAMGCSEELPAPDLTPDDGVMQDADASASPDVGRAGDADGTVECCPVQTNYNCYQLGGTRYFGNCPRLCTNCEPAGWSYTVDDNGCSAANPLGPMNCDRDMGFAD